jgi:hypothetical protein
MVLTAEDRKIIELLGLSEEAYMRTLRAEQEAKARAGGGARTMLNDMRLVTIAGAGAFVNSGGKIDEASVLVAQAVAAGALAPHMAAGYTRAVREDPVNGRLLIQQLLRMR